MRLGRRSKAAAVRLGGASRQRAACGARGGGGGRRSGSLRIRSGRWRRPPGAAQDLARRGRGLNLSVPNFRLVVVQTTVCTDAQAIGLREALHTVAEGAVSPFVPALAAEAREHLLVGAMAAGVRGEAAVKARAGRLGRACVLQVAWNATKHADGFGQHRGARGAAFTLQGLTRRARITIGARKFRVRRPKANRVTTAASGRRVAALMRP